MSPPDTFIFDPDKEKEIIAFRFAELPQESIEYAFQQHFQDCIEFAIGNKRDFVIETNFRDQALLDPVEQFKANGYITNMIYLVLDSVHESMDRVKHRVNNGGHHVDDQSVFINYTEGLKNLEYYSGRFDNLEIIDASGSYFKLRSVLSIQHQRLVYRSTELPKDAEQTINRIADRYDNSWQRGDEEEPDRPRGPRR